MCPVALTLKIATQLFCMTLQHMVIHHHTSFGCKRLSSSEDIFCTEPSHMDRVNTKYTPLHPTHFVTRGIKEK